MTVIQLSAGKKHTIRIGDTVREVTLRPGEVRYEPFLREVMDIPTITLPYTPRKAGPPDTLPYTPRKAGPPDTLPYTPRVTKKTYASWSGARPKPTFDDIIELVKGVRGKKDLGFKPTLDNLISLLRQYRP